MAAGPRYLSPGEYLARERQAQTKSEYLDGRVVAMVGASENHNLLQMSTGTALYLEVRGRGCRVYPSDMRVRIPRCRAYTYPTPRSSVASRSSKMADATRSSTRS